MNLHPFELKIEQLETLNQELETLNSQEAEQAIGGFVDVTTWMTGEEGGNPITRFVGEGGISMIQENGTFPGFPLTTSCDASEGGCGTYNRTNSRITFASSRTAKIE